jgi:hypothetical protein
VSLGGVTETIRTDEDGRAEFEGYRDGEVKVFVNGLLYVSGKEEVRQVEISGAKLCHYIFFLVGLQLAEPYLFDCSSRVNHQ